jgi:hypothetical protein
MLNRSSPRPFTRHLSSQRVTAEDHDPDIQQISSQSLQRALAPIDQNAGGPGVALGVLNRTNMIFHDDSIEEENDLDFEDLTASLQPSGVRAATTLNEYAELLSAALVRQACGTILKNQARQRALLRAAANMSRRASSQFAGRRYPPTWLSNTSLITAACASGRPPVADSALFNERYCNIPGAPPLYRTRASIAGGKSFEFSKDLSGAAPTKLDAKRRTKKFSLPSSVIQAGLAAAHAQRFVTTYRSIALQFEDIRLKGSKVNKSLTGKVN